jgi:hypothetical protein
MKKQRGFLVTIHPQLIHYSKYNKIAEIAFPCVLLVPFIVHASHLATFRPGARHSFQEGI